MKKAKNIFLKRPYIYSVLVLIILAGIGFTTIGGSNSTVETQTISRSTFKRQVAVSGKVVAAQSANLGFEQGGRLASINSAIGSVVTKGTVIASLENGDARAELLQKQAALEREQSKLASLIQGTRPEQLNIDRQDYTDASRSLVTAMLAAQLDTEYAFLNYVDVIFTNGTSANPNFSVPIDSYTEERALERDRLISTEKINHWKDTLTHLKEPLESAQLESARTLTLDTLSFIRTLTNRLTKITADLSSVNSGLTQAQIDSHRTSINTANQEIITVIDSIQTAQATWIQSRDSLTLSESGTIASDISAQNASVKAAQADVESALARIRKTLIVAPFDGTVTRMDIKVGEIIASNSSQISLMNTNSFNIESYVPEVHIAHIKPGNIAKVTLDAYDTETIFEAGVATVDPAETIRDGVSTYKVVLSFQSNDPRIKSGMTGSVSIITLEKPDAIMVLQSALIKRDGRQYIQKKMDEEIVEVLVEIGDSTSLGQVEIISGLSEGDSIVLTPPKN